MKHTGGTSGNEFLKRMETQYEKFSKGQRLLADYIIENYDKAVFLTAAKLGEVVASVSPQLFALPRSLGTVDIRASRKRWKNL